MLQLNGQKVLITGASGGLGGSLAARFLDVGATVLLHTRDPHRGEALAEQLSGSGDRWDLPGGHHRPNLGQRPRCSLGRGAAP